MNPICRWLVLIAALLLGSASATSQDAPPDKPSRATIADLARQIDDRQTEIEQDTTLDDATRAAALQRLSEGRAFLEQATADIEATELIAQERAAAPELQAAAAKGLAELSRPRPPADTVGLGASDLKIAADEAAAAARSAQTNRAALEEQRNALRARRPVIGPELAAARAALASVRERQVEIRIASETRPGTRTSLPRALAEEQALLARIAFLEEQRAGLDVREQLSTARLELARQTAAASLVRAETLGEAYHQRRRAELLDEADSASAGMIAREPELQAMAEANAALLQDHPSDGRAAAISAAQRELDAIEAALADLKADSQYTERILTTLGRSYAAGQVIVEALRSLPAEDRHVAAVRDRARQIENVQLDVVSLSRDRSRLERELQRSPEAEPGSEEVGVPALLHRLRASRLELLDEVLRSLEEYASILAETQGRERTLISQLARYESILRSRQAWVPNIEPIAVRDMRGAVRGLGTLVDSDLWRGSITAWTAWFRDQPLRVLAGLVTMILAGAVGRRLARVTPVAAERAANGSMTTRVAYGALPALLAATAIAIAVWLAAWLIGSAPETSPGAAALGVGLRRVAVGVLLIMAVHLLYSSRGPLLRQRPDWVERAAAFRKANRRIAWVLPLLVLCGILFEAHVAAIGTHSETAARLCLILGALVIAWAVLAAMQASRRPLAASYGSEPQVSPRQWHRWLYLPGLLLPAALCVAVVDGYVLAALLAMRALIGALILLAIYVAARDIILVSDDATRARAPESIDERLNDRNRLAGITLLVLLSVAQIWIWEEIFSALAYLREVALWTTETEQGVTAVTVADVGMFLIVLGSTLVAFWALPVLAGTKSLDTSRPGIGARYATVTLVRYAVLIVGVLTAFSLLNVGWSKLQWMAAGLSVGLGFGLQESVANFIAGLMLLTESQVRVGDLITVGDKTGIVSRIQVRATTVKDFDGREIILPNKDLVTTEVTNWTLSDSNRRIQIVVGVAYGSDTELVEKLMLEAVDLVPWVMTFPAPRVVFEEFANDALKFRLYVWIDSGQRVLDTIHGLHRAIDRLFREHGIEIAFPQRDIHLDAATPLDIRLVPASSQRTADDGR